MIGNIFRSLSLDPKEASVLTIRAKLQLLTLESTTPSSSKTIDGCVGSCRQFHGWSCLQLIEMLFRTLSLETLAKQLGCRERHSLWAGRRLLWTADGSFVRPELKGWFFFSPPDIWSMQSNFKHVFCVSETENAQWKRYFWRVQTLRENQQLLRRWL